MSRKNVTSWDVKNQKFYSKSCFIFKHVFCLNNKWSWTIWLASYSRNNKQCAEKRLSAASIRGSGSSIWHKHSEMWTVCWIALNKPRLFRNSCRHSFYLHHMQTREFPFALSNGNYLSLLELKEVREMEQKQMIEREWVMGRRNRKWGGEIERGKDTPHLLIQRSLVRLRVCPVFVCRMESHGKRETLPYLATERFKISASLYCHKKVSSQADTSQAVQIPIRMFCFPCALTKNETKKKKKRERGEADGNLSTNLCDI